MVAQRFGADTLFKIGEIEIGIKIGELPGLREQIGRGSAGILAHAIGDHVFEREDAQRAVHTGCVDQANAHRIGRVAHRARSDDFEAEAEIGMHPAARRLARAGGADETEALQFLLQLGLDWRGDVDVAGHHRAAGVKLDCAAADEDRAGKAARRHRLADLREQAERGEELRAPREWGGHGASIGLGGGGVEGRELDIVSPELPFVPKNSL